MTEPSVSPPARPRARPRPGHTLLPSGSHAVLHSRLATPSSDGRQSLCRSALQLRAAQMSPLSGRLCLLTLVALILPSRGQTSEETTSSSSVDQTSVDTPHVTDTDNPEVHSTSPIPTWNIDETTESQTVAETSQETQQPTETDTTLLMTDPGTGSEKAHAPEGTTQFPRNDSPSPVKDNCVKVQTPKPSGSKGEDPFYYDNTTLRRRGLLVAAVLFITGIIILTSGKCRHLSGICRNHHRAYRVVNKRCPGKEEAAAGTQA